MDERVIGRASELGEIAGFTSDPDAPLALLITGQPGMGKTALLDEGILRARERGAMVLEARGSQAETRHSFAALINLLDGIDLKGLDTVPEPQRRALEVALLREPAPSAGNDRHATALGVLASLRALSASAPLFLAIDDIHWIDHASAEALAYAFRRLEGSRIHLLVAKRTGESDTVIGSIGRGAATRIELGPLSVEEIRGVVFAKLGIAFPRRVIREIHQASLGNPFTAIELARLQEERGPLRIGEDLPASNLPRDLPVARIESLPEIMRDLLLVVSLSGGISPGHLVELGFGAALDEAIDGGLVVLRRQQVEAAHPMLAAASREASGTRRRRELHLALARISSENETEARHLALATITPDDELAGKLRAASIEAGKRGAGETSVELAEHALRLTEAHSPDRSERMLCLADALCVAGEGRRLKELLELELERIPPGPDRGNALLYLCDAVVLHGASVDGGEGPEALLQRAVMESDGDPTVRAVALAQNVEYLVLAHVERLPEALRLAEDAVAASAGADSEAKRHALRALAWCRVLTGRPIADLQHQLEEVRDEYLRVDTIDRIAAVHQMWRGELVEARTAMRQTMALADERGEGISYFTVRLDLCSLELRAGNWATARELLDEAEQSAGESRLLNSTRLRCAAILAAGEGDFDEGMVLAESALETAGRTGARWDELEGRRARAVLRLLANDPAGAAEDLDAVWQYTGENGVDEVGAFPVASDLVEALVDLGEVARAESVLDRLSQSAKALEHPWAGLAVLRGRLSLRLSEGPDAAAAEELRQVAESFGELDLKFDRARTLLALGRFQRRHKQWGGARRALEDAASAFSRIGSNGWVDRSEEELRRVSARPPRATGELTPSERNTCELAAQGFANKEIAQRQFVSVSTVEAHLTRAYAKLGIRSRSQLAEKLAASPLDPK